VHCGQESRPEDSAGFPTTARAGTLLDPKQPSPRVVPSGKGGALPPPAQLLRQPRVATITAPMSARTVGGTPGPFGCFDQGDCATPSPKAIAHQPSPLETGRHHALVAPNPAPLVSRRTFPVFGRRSRAPGKQGQPPKRTASFCAGTFRRGRGFSKADKTDRPQTPDTPHGLNYVLVMVGRHRNLLWYLGLGLRLVRRASDGALWAASRSAITSVIKMQVRWPPELTSSCSSSDVAPKDHRSHEGPLPREQPSTFLTGSSPCFCAICNNPLRNKHAGLSCAPNPR